MPQRKVGPTGGRLSRRRSETAPAPAAPEAGFSLVEVLVAMALLVMLSSAVAGLFANSMLTLQASKEKYEANRLATGAMEQLRSIPAADLTKGQQSGDLDDDQVLVDGTDGRYLKSPLPYEKVVPATDSTWTPPYPLRKNVLVVDGRRYDLRAYVTSASSVATGLYRLTVVVTYTKTTGAGGRTRLITQSLINPSIT